MIIGMSVYQIAKYLMVPGLSLIKSNIITDFFQFHRCHSLRLFRLTEASGPLSSRLLREIAERRKAGAEIKKLNEDLEYHITQIEAANKELESFSYSVSHDLRAPLRHVIGYIELLQKNASPVLDEKSLRYLTTISESAKRMGILIDDLLDFSRIGRTEMQETVFSPEQLIKEVRSELQHEMTGREIAWQIGPLPDIHGDRSLMKLVFLNLLANAIKFTASRERAT